MERVQAQECDVVVDLQGTVAVEITKAGVEVWPEIVERLGHRSEGALPEALQEHDQLHATLSVIMEMFGNYMQRKDSWPIRPSVQVKSGAVVKLREPKAGGILRPVQ